MQVVPAKSVAKKKTTKRAKDEVTRLGSALRTLGGLGGGALGNVFGYAEEGRGIGNSLGATISRWLGSGDYAVSSNSLVQRVGAGSPAIPAMHKTGQAITVRHKEFVCSVKGSIGYAVQRFFLLQPGDSNTFPWLSGLASRYQQYRIKGMVFHYVPTSGTAVSGSNPALGAVMLQTSYRVNDTPPTSKAEMMNEYWASEAAPSESFCHPIECDPRENPFSVHYIRDAPVPANDSPMMYDIGVTYVATQGMPGDGNIVGDLWVTYEIELTKPMVLSSVTGNVGYTVISGTTPAPGNWLPAVGLSTIGNTGFTWVSNTLNFPLGATGTYMVLAQVEATTTFTAIDLSGAIAYANCSFFPAALGGATYTRTVVTAATTANRGFFAVAVVLSDPSSQASITVPAGTWTGTALRSLVTITRMV